MGWVVSAVISMSVLTAQAAGLPRWDFQGATHPFQPSTDAIIGGSSRAVLEVAADGENRCLLVTGEVVAGAPRIWAGAVVFPGANPVTAVDVSTARVLRFRAKGEGTSLGVLFYTKARGFNPTTPHRVTLGGDWQSFEVVLASLPDLDATGVTGIAFTVAAPGKVSFRIDDIRFE